MSDFAITGASFWHDLAARGVTPEDAVGALISMAGYRGPWLKREYSRPSNIRNLLGLTRLFSFFTESDYRSLIIFLETALTDGLQPTDLSISPNRRNFSLSKGRIETKFASQLQASPSWRKVFSFIRRWLAEEPFTSHLYDHFWMEFDIQEGEQNPVPNIFFGISPGGDYLAMAASCLESLGLPAGNNGWRKVVAGVEGRAEMLHLGAMLARPSAPLRVVALGLAPGAGDYVIEVGGRSLADDNAYRWRKLEPFIDGLSGISFDVDWHSGEIGPRVGAEYDFSYCKDRPEERRRRLESFLRCLAEQGWCCWPKAEGVLTFPGRHLCRRNGLAAGTILQTGVSHIKLDFSRGGPPRVKAYGELIMVETAGRDI